jgi:gliding motility-associated-like protein
MSSTITGLDEGGYRVVISGGGFSGSFDAWVYLDSPTAAASLMNATCDYVALRGEVAEDTYYYRDPSNGAAIQLPNGIRFMWSSDPASTLPYPDYDLSPQTFDPPLTDLTYMLTVTDSMGCSMVSSFFYESIHVKADFAVEPAAGEAPLEVSFTDKSVRASKYSWEFGNEETSDLADPGTRTYYYPGQYSVRLVVESDLHCIDSMRFNSINVEDSRLAVPNVFTPDGDGFNDMFVVEKRSLKYINVKIYSRSGLKVYSFDGEGDQLKEWEGWDGYVNNSSAKASPGVYYYVIRAEGWDDVIYDNREYRGFVYLYR